MVQSTTFILSAIALLGFSQLAVDAAPSTNAAHTLFGRIHKSRFLYARDDAANNTSCPVALNNNTIEALNHFQGIFFGDYFLSNQNVEGPLAVGGQLSGANFTINSASNGTTLCQSNVTSANPFEQHGLVLAGQSQTTNISVQGNAYLASGVNVGIVAPSCSVEFNSGTGNLDFDALKAASDEISRYLASQTPNLLLNQRGKVKKINGTNADQDGFYSLKFNTCQNANNCGVEESQASVPQDILFANGTKWKGAKFPRDKPVVLNIPVTTGTTLVINSNNPSKDLSACKTVFHAYPVDSQGNFLANGSFSVNQETNKYIKGLFFAPRATITGGAKGGFKGQVIALGYNGGSAFGPALKSYKKETCMAERNCFPFKIEEQKNNKEPTNTTSVGGTTSISLQQTAATSVKVYKRDANESTQPIPEPTATPETMTTVISPPSFTESNISVKPIRTKKGHKTVIKYTSVKTKTKLKIKTKVYKSTITIPKAEATN